MNKDANLTRTQDHTWAWSALKPEKAIWADMEAAGLVIKEEPYLMNVPRSQGGWRDC